MLMHPASTRAPRRAFTLVEAVIAIALCGIVVLTARIMVEELASATQKTMIAARDADRIANADRVLRSLVGRAEVGRPVDRPFGGDADSVHFTTWCEASGGWLERCDATLALEVSRHGALLVIHLSPGQGGDVGPRELHLREDFHSGVLRYLEDPAGGGAWYVQWGDGNVAPRALGVVLDGDTTILRIGGSP
jgi:hypothetical protein